MEILVPIIGAFVALAFTVLFTSKFDAIIGLRPTAEQAIPPPERFLFRIILPELLRTAFHQYFVFFNEYIRASKGQNVNLVVEENDSGITLIAKVSSAFSEEDLREWIAEYAAHIHSKSPPEIVVSREEVDPGMFDLLVLKLEGQVSLLQNSLKQAQFEVHLLERDRDRLRTDHEWMKTLVERTVAGQPVQVIVGGMIGSGVLATKAPGLTELIYSSGLQSNQQQTILEQLTKLLDEKRDKAERSSSAQAITEFVKGAGNKLGSELGKTLVSLVAKVYDGLV